MGNLKQLRDRVKSIKSTAKLTKAMKMVAASRLTKTKKDLISSELYVNSINSIISNLNFEEIIENSEYISDSIKKYFLFIPEIVEEYGDSVGSVKKYLGEAPAAGVVLLILCSSDKGLCGNFNTALGKKLKQDILNFQENHEKVKLIIIGRKGYNLLNAEFKDIIVEYVDTHQLPKEEIALKVKYLIDRIIESNNISECSIYFNLFKNAMIQIPTHRLLLPLNKIIKNVGAEFKNYEYEGSNLIETAIKLHIEGEIKFALMQSAASEEGARLTAMDNATNNANDLVDNLTLKLNKTRQANITRELTEIISGVEAI